jgi:hypothetical protein
VLAPQVDGSGLQGYFTDPKAASSYKFPIPVDIALAPEGTAQVSRANDSVPWWAGSITRVGGGICTTGFAVMRGTTRGLLSAGHCNPAGGGVFTNGTGVPIGRAGLPVTISDSIFIPSPSAGRTYVGGVGSSASMAVIAPIPNFPGQWVCTEGAATGEHCAITNFLVGGVSFIGGTVTLGITLAFRWFGGVAVGSGDSGGPVIVSSNPFFALAAGLIDFAVGGTTCPPGVGLGGVCSSVVGYVDINWVLATQFPMALVP